MTSIFDGTRAMKLTNRYCINVEQRNWNLYYLTNGIYPPMSIFLKTILNPQNALQPNNKAAEKMSKDFSAFYEEDFAFQDMSFMSGVTVL